MFRYSQPFPDNYQNYKLRYTGGYLTKWHTPFEGVYICSGVNGRYEIHVRDDNIINAITFYSERTGKLEIDSKSIPCIYLEPLLI